MSLFTLSVQFYLSFKNVMIRANEWEVPPPSFLLPFFLGNKT